MQQRQCQLCSLHAILAISTEFRDATRRCCFHIRWHGHATPRRPTGRERMGSPTLQTLQDPILLQPWLCFRGGGFPNPKEKPYDRVGWRAQEIVHAKSNEKVTCDADPGFYLK